MFPRFPNYGPGLLGKVIDSVVAGPITHPMHRVQTTATLTTLLPPVSDLGFWGPVHLIADSIFTWTTSGNIAAAPGTTLIAGRVASFIWDRVAGKWYSLGASA